MIANEIALLRKSQTNQLAVHIYVRSLALLKYLLLCDLLPKPPIAQRPAQLEISRHSTAILTDVISLCLQPLCIFSAATCGNHLCQRAACLREHIRNLPMHKLPLLGQQKPYALHHGLCLIERTRPWHAHHYAASTHQIDGVKINLC